MADNIDNLKQSDVNNLKGLTAQLKESILRKHPTRDDVDYLKRTIDSRGSGLLTNGTGSLGGVKSSLGNDILMNFSADYPANNYRYDLLTDGTLLDGSAAGYTTTGYTAMGTGPHSSENEIMSLNSSVAYVGGGSIIPNASAAAAGRKNYTGLNFVDQNGLGITSTYTLHKGLAKLAQDLNLGTDTYMYITREGFEGNLDPHTEWGTEGTTTYSTWKGPIFWDHHYRPFKVDSDGNDIMHTCVPGSVGDINKPAGFGYSRHYVLSLWDSNTPFERVGDHNGYTNVWRIPINTTGYSHMGEEYSPASSQEFIPEGTPVSRNMSGGTYQYCFASAYRLTDENKIWRFKGYIGGANFSGVGRSYCIPPGATGAKWLVLGVYRSGRTPKLDNNAVDKHHTSGMFLTEDTSVDLIKKSYGALPEHYYYQMKGMRDGSYVSFASPTYSQTKRTVL